MKKSGALSGLTRVRSFAQDDAHIFLREDQIHTEINSLLETYFLCYRHFSFDNIKILLSTRPIDRAGDDRQWDLAEGSLKTALDHFGEDYEINEGDGAFYGPKIDIAVSDAIGRLHQLGTIQLDFQLPEKFDLEFVASDGSMKRPVVIHKALLGSLERFFAIYLEHVAGAFPFWLAPQQAVIIPVNEKIHSSYAEEIFTNLNKEGYRIHVDNRNETLGLKTRQTQKAKIPFMLVVGDTEMKDKTVNVRTYGEKKTEKLTLAALKERFFKLSRNKIPQFLDAL